MLAQAGWDVERDGFPDVLLGPAGGSGVVIYGANLPSLQNGVQVPGLTGKADEVTLADLNGDGWLDAVGATLPVAPRSPNP